MELAKVTDCHNTCRLAGHNTGMSHDLFLSQAWAWLKELVLTQLLMMVRHNLLVWMLRESSLEVGSGCHIPEHLQCRSLCSSTSVNLASEHTSFLKVIKYLFMDMEVAPGLWQGYLLSVFLPENLSNCCRACSVRTSICLQKETVGAGGIEVNISAPGQETKIFSVVWFHPVGFAAVLILLQAHLNNCNSCPC